MSSEPRRVLMTADAVGGVWTFALGLAGGLRRAGLDVTLAVMGPSPADDQRAAARRVADLREMPCALEWMRSPWQDVERAGEWLLSLEREVGPDVIHLNGYAHAALPFRAPVLVVAHSCVCSWWRACRGEPAPSEWDMYRAKVRAGLARAKLVIAPTSAMMSALLAEHAPRGELVAHTQIIPNASDPTRFFSAPRKLSLVLGVGRLWDEAKNLRVLDAIAGQLSWPVAIAGSDVDPDGQRVSIDGALHLGVLPPDLVASWMSQSAIYALPARYEPFGLSALEAALSACALVLGDIPSLRENWEGAAQFVRSDDPGAIRAGIQEVIDDAALRTRLAFAARRRALELGDPRRSVTRYLRAYSALLTNEDPGALQCA